MKHFTLFLALFLILPSLHSQSIPLDCTDGRYTMPLYDASTIVEESIFFGNNLTADGVNQELEMLIYHNPEDTAYARPVIILAFGGGFIAGQKEDLSGLAIELATQGYVTAVIDYRLYNFWVLGFPDATDMQDAAAKAVSDMKAAIKMIRFKAEQESRLKINPERIFVGGLSAGAITAIHTAYMGEDDLDSELGDVIEDNGGLQGDSNYEYTADYGTEVSGVINLSGAIFDLDFIDFEEAPLLSMHGTIDDTVPYEEGLAADLVPVKGSKLMHDRATEVGIYNTLLTVEGGNHSDIYTSAEFADDRLQFNDARADFFNNVLCGVVSVEDFNLTPLHIYPNPVSDWLQLDLSDQADVMILDFSGNIVLEKDSIDAVNVDQLSPGVYIILVEHDGKRSVEKFVKR